MIAFTEQDRAGWQTAAVMGVVGALFVVLAVTTGNLTLWLSAGAINFIGAADSLRRQYCLSSATA